MKISVNRDQIIEGLQKAAAILPAKAGAAYLRSIWLRAEKGQLSIMATDANLEFTGSYPAEVHEPGLIGVQGRLFVDLVRQLPRGVMEISVEKDNTILVLKQGKRSYKLPVNSAEWFQDFSRFPDDAPVTWSGDYLQELLERITFCIDDDDTRDAIACLYMRPQAGGRIEVCGLNGHQFAMVVFTNDDLCARLPEKGLLIQKKYLADMKKWLGADDIELNLSDKRLYLKRVDNAELLSVPIVGYEYPDYNVFLSKLTDPANSTLTIPRKETMEAFGRIAVFNTENEQCVFMELNPSELNLSAEGPDVGSARESLPASYEGTIRHITFPTKKLLEIFGHFSSENLALVFTGEEGPCGITGADDAGYTVIIMPMKVAEKVYYTEEEL